MNIIIYVLTLYSLISFKNIPFYIFLFINNLYIVNYDTALFHLHLNVHFKLKSTMQIMIRLIRL